MSVSLEELPLPRRARSVRTRNFLGGFASLFRSFPPSVFPPHKSLWEQSGDDIRECWQDVGDDLRVALNAYEGEQEPLTHSQRVVFFKDSQTVRIIDEKEALRFSKHFEKLNPDTQKFVLALAHDSAKD